MGKLKIKNMNTKIHKSFKKTSQKTNKISKGAVKRIDKIGSFTGKKISDITDSIKGIAQSPLFLPILGIVGVGAIMVLK